MSGEGLGEWYSELPPTLAACTDRLCDRFEQDWQDGRKPRIEDYLGEIPESGRHALLRELLWLELGYRKLQGERPGPEEYESRFPAFLGAVRDVFDPTERTRVGRGSAGAHAGLDLLSGPASAWRDWIGPKVLDEVRRGAAPDPGEGPVCRFHVLRPLASGGLGAVSVALDEELDREVAFKQVQDRFANDPINRARFLAEAAITGKLEHPGIVPIYGLGWHEGRPFYAMRLIRGESLKQAIEQLPRDGDPGARTLALRKMLSRFVTVCDTVEYAHSRGMVHRDIKPANIMLGPYGETLLVDWGLATPISRTSAGPNCPTPGPTVTDQRAGILDSPVGTPAYMSPEQAAGRRRASPASDVYCLGATLYHLITGVQPFRGRDVLSVLDLVRRGYFPPPRRVDPTVDAALEAVCLKAMALRPEDRYPSARALADDIERWMADEPVGALREPFSRRARRWTRRHRTAVGVATVGLLASVLGLSAVAAVQSRANYVLGLAYEEKSRALEETTKAKQAAEEARDQARAVLAFLKRDVLAAARPKGQEGGLGPNVTIREAVDAAEAKVAGAFLEQPIVEAEVRGAFGQTYLYLGEVRESVRQFEIALELCEKARGPHHPDTLAHRNDLAAAYLDAGRMPEAVRMHEGTLALMTSIHGPDHPETLVSRNNLAIAYRAAGMTEEVIKMHEETLRLREATLGAAALGTLISRNNLAEAYGDAARYEDAIRLHVRTLELMKATLDADHPVRIATLSNLGNAWGYVDLERSIPILKEAVTLGDAALGADHPSTLISRNNLASAYRDAGRLDDALRLLEDTLPLQEKRLGREHQDTLTTRSNLGALYNAKGRPEDAARLHAETLRLREETLGPEHRDTLVSRNNLAMACWAGGRQAEAIDLWEKMLPALRLAFGADHPSTLKIEGSLAFALENVGRSTEAADLLVEIVARRRASGGPNSPELASDLSGLGYNLLRRSRYDEAEPILRECVAIRRKAIPDDFRRYYAEGLLGAALVGQGRHDEAEPLILGGYEGVKAREAKVPAPNRYVLSETAGWVLELYESWGKPEQLEAWKKKLGLGDLPADPFMP
jgi:tetratricopeptide (TPR) repeat protein